VTEAVRYPRRTLLTASAVLLLTGCAPISSLLTKPVVESDPQKAIADYFALLSQNRYDDAKTLLTPDYQSRLGDSKVDTFLHSVRTASVSKMVDAVEWANGLGAHLPAPPADRREYLVTLQVDPNPTGKTDWSEGMNRRFVDVVNSGPGWRIDNIGMSPGVLVTGQPVAAAASDVHAAVIPISQLRLGPAPVDRAIYTARQNAADRGGIPWAIDPVQVAQRDGPSFGWNASDQAFLLAQDQDPKTLGPRAMVEVNHGDQLIVVTLVQPIRVGKGGVWAIAQVDLGDGKTK